nr:GAP family protein [Halorhabdus rudnickae]
MERDGAVWGKVTEKGRIGAGILILTAAVLLIFSATSPAIAAPDTEVTAATSAPATTVLDGEGPPAQGGLEDYQTSANSTTVHIVYFYSPNCPHCEDTEEFFAAMNETHDLQIREYRVQLNSEAFREYLEEYDVPEQLWGGTPTVFIDDGYAVGTEQVKSLVNQTIAEGGTDTFPTLSGSQSLGGRSLSLGLISTLATLAAGDAVNPCALAVLLILLTTVLTRHPDNQRRVLASGLAFSLSVMLTYFVMGYLLISGLKTVASISAIDLSFIRYAFGGLAVVFGVLNVYDWISSGSSLTPEVPESWKPTMQRYLTEPLWERRSVITGSVIAGILVSLFLLPCTSGPYLVAGGLLASVPWIQAIPALIFYNLLFILPMVGITVAVSSGFAAVEDISSWREENIHRLNLIAGIILVVLGALIVFGVL